MDLGRQIAAFDAGLVVGEGALPRGVKLLLDLMAASNLATTKRRHASMVQARHSGKLLDGPTDHYGVRDCERATAEGLKEVLNASRSL